MMMQKSSGNIIYYMCRGCIYSASRKSDGMEVALKFFGYTAHPAIEESIMLEIEMMQALEGTGGAVEIYGLMMDTVEGLVPAKRHKLSKPVIVMEYLAGGDMFQRISANDMTEEDLAKIVLHIVKTLNHFHAHGFVHRDLKLENIMFCDKSNDEVRIIDYGLMVTLPRGQDTYIGSGVPVGSPGFIAPESLLRSEYSAKSDMWQLGCCVYSLLSGFNAFFSDMVSQTLAGEFFPMAGEEWRVISRQAKDFVANLLTVDPVQRPSGEDLLRHPWLLDLQAPQRPVSEKLGSSYRSRMKALGIRSKMKRFFAENTPMLDTADRASLGEVLRVDSPTAELRLGPSFRHKLKVFQDLTITSMGLEGVGAELKFDQFAENLRLADLPELAVPEVFHIFDCNKSGASAGLWSLLVSFSYDLFLLHMVT